MKDKLFALSAALTLLLTSGIAVAFGGGGPDGTIDTYFTADGVGPSFESALVLDDDNYMIESVTIELWGIPALGFGEMTVIENIDLDDHRRYTDANIDKQITVDPGSFWFLESTAHVVKEAAWDGTGEVYRYAELGDTVSIVDASTLYGDALFVDNIEYNDDVFVYQSVGLNRYATCDPVEMPERPDMPECGWC